jgi:hypothetical protein
VALPSLDDCNGAINTLAGGWTNDLGTLRYTGLGRLRAFTAEHITMRWTADPFDPAQYAQAQWDGGQFGMVLTRQTLTTGLNGYGFAVGPTVYFQRFDGGVVSNLATFPGPTAAPHTIRLEHAVHTDATHASGAAGVGTYLAQASLDDLEVGNLAGTPPPIPGGGAGTLVEALRDRLLTLAPVTDLVGSRIYALKFPQSVTAPALRLQEIDRVAAMQLRGDDHLRRSRVQIDAIESETHGPDPYDTVHQLAAAVRGDLTTGTPSGLVGFTGDLSGLAVRAILADDLRESYDAETRMLRVEVDVLVWFHV